MITNSIYLLYSCDEWKSRTSMSLVVATGNPLVLKNVLSSEVAKNNMEIGEKEVLSLPVEDINERLDYGYIEIVEDGEVQ